MLMIRLCALTVLVLTGAGAIVTEADRPVLTDAALSPADILQDGDAAPVVVDAG